MTRPLHIDLATDHRRLVLNILRAHLPQKTKAWVFGSRATGPARRYSDLDLAIDAGRRLTVDEIAVLIEAFSDCALTYRVDLVDWREIDDRWRQANRGQAHSLEAAALGWLPIPALRPGAGRDHAAGFSCTSMAIA